MSEEGKKRKRVRVSGETERPAKKVAIQSPQEAPSKVKVSVLPRDDTWIPALVSTPGTNIPSDLPFKAYRKTLTASSPAELTRTSSYSYLLQSSAHPRLDYLAKEDDDSGASRLRKHYVGVFDPSTGELQVIEARNMVMRASVRPTEEEEEEKERKNYRSQRNDLGLAFGTKKSKKAINSMKINAISPMKTASQLSSTTTIPETPIKKDPRSAALLSTMSSPTDVVMSREQKEALVNENKPVPRPNLEAVTPEEVYPIDQIIGSEMMKQLTILEWQETIKRGEKVMTRSRFVSERLDKLIMAEQIRKLKVLKYMKILLDFFFTLKPTRQGKKVPQEKELEELMEVPIVIVKQVKKRFTDGMIMSKWHVDNLMTHLAALALIVDDFEVDTFELQEDLMLEQKPMTKYFQELGCKVSLLTEGDKKRLKIGTKAAAALHRIARLKIPLQFPKLRVPKAKKNIR